MIVCIYMYIYIYIDIHLFVYLFMYLLFNLCTFYLSMHRHLSIDPSIHPSVYIKIIKSCTYRLMSQLELSSSKKGNRKHTLKMKPPARFESSSLSCWSSSCNSSLDLPATKDWGETLGSQAILTGPPPPGCLCRVVLQVLWHLVHLLRHAVAAHGRNGWTQ